MKGRRVEYRESWQPNKGPQPGDYWKDSGGYFGGVTPNGHFCNLAAHAIIEHDDATITVTPSILVSGNVGVSPVRTMWHGWLKNGEWIEA
jgi:hypothetical protein